MLIGAHVSPAGGLEKAVARGVELKADSIQIFNQSPRMWRPTGYAEEDFAAFRDALGPSRVGAVLIHAVYLVNCASEDPEIRDKSLTSLTHSLRVGDAIGAAGVVLHPGSAKGGHVQAAIDRAGTVIAESLSESDGCPLRLEDTAGAGGTLRALGFLELVSLIEGGRRPSPDPGVFSSTPVTCWHPVTTSGPPAGSTRRSTSAGTRSGSSG